MHPDKIKSIKKSISDIIKAYYENENERNSASQFNYQCIANQECNKIKKQLYKEAEFVNKFSERYIDNKLWEIVYSLTSGRILNINDEIDNFVELLESFNIKRTVFLPLSGIEVKNPQKEYKLGYISLVSPTEERRSKTLKLLKYILQKNRHHSDEEKNYASDHISSIINKCFQDASALAKYTVVAEPIRAKERAKEETRRVLEILRFFGTLEYDPSWNTRVCLFGESYPNKDSIICYEPTQLDTELYKVGPIRTLELSDELIEKIKKLGAYKLLKLITKPDLSEFEEKLLSSIHWIACSQMQNENENKLLNLITSLETVLTRSKGQPIQLSIAEGSAFIIGDSLIKRREIKEKIEELYDKRSKLSHGGKKIIMDEDIKILTDYSKRLLLRLLKKTNKFKCQKDLFNWIDEKKLK